MLDRFFEELEACLKRSFPRYIVKASQLGESFIVLVKRPKGKILKNDRAFLCKRVQQISQDIYRKYAGNCTKFSYKYFPYFKLVKCYGNYHHHFLVVKKDYYYG